MGKTILITGGARSGKSGIAETMALSLGRPATYIATAEAHDAEMAARIAAHQARRGADWITRPAPLALAEALAATDGGGARLVDCLTLWLSNILQGGLDPRRESEVLLEAALSAPAAVILVTNEVGCGIVPDNELARRFRDEAGWLNQRAAAAAAEVWLTAFGCALRLK